MDSICTICQSCYFYCGLRVFREGSTIVRIEGLPEHPTNRGTICPKGLAAQQLVTDPRRLLHPQKRVGPRGSGRWKRISWDEAMTLLAGKLRAAKESDGAESVVYHRGHAPGWVTTMNYVTRLMNAFGSPNLLTHAHLCFAPRAIAHAATYGGVPEPDFDAAQCILLWGFNPVYTSLPNYARRIVDAKARGAKLVVIDPRFTPTAAKADLWLQPRPSTDPALGMGIVKVLVEEKLYDADFVRDYTVGFDQLAAHVASIELADVEATTGVPADLIRRAARILSESRPTVVKEGNGLDQHVNVVQAVRTVALVTTLLGSINARGGDVLVPALPFEDVQLRGKREEDWEGRSLSTHPLYYRTGNSIHDEELFQALETGKPYTIRALFVQGGALVEANANVARTRRLLQKIDFIAVHDLYPTATADIADLVLPAASFLERNLLLYYRYRPSAQMNLVALQQQVVPPAGESRADLDVVFDLARRLGLEKEFPWRSSEEAFDWELKPLGISIDYLRRHPEGHQVLYGPAELYWSHGRHGFATNSGKVELYGARLAAFGYAPLPELERIPPQLDASVESPLLCGTGLKLGIHTHTEFRTLPWIHGIEPVPFLEIHPSTAQSLDVSEASTVSIESPWGSVTAVARLTEGVSPDVVMLAYGYGEPYATTEWRLANELTPDGSIASDPISGATSNRRVPVRVRALVKTGRAARARRCLVEDLDRCVGCHTCEIACLQEHGEKRVRILALGPTAKGDHQMQMDYVVLGTDACDLCSGRAARGLAPACVSSCPTHSLASVTEEAAERMLRAGRRHLCAAERGVRNG